MNRAIFRAGRRNRYAAPIGGVFIILCLVGFFTVASFCLNKIGRASSRERV